MTKTRSLCGLIIAAPSSGSGKTAVTIGILRALSQQGLKVAGAKVGPDYIDPSFHAAATNLKCRNLDPWAMRKKSINSAIATTATEAEIVIVEGVMGLFDGIDAVGTGSTADLAIQLGWPVIMVLDARRSTASLAAVLGGFKQHNPEVKIVGFVINQVGSINHADIVSTSCQQRYPDIAFLGCLPRIKGLNIEEQHLGLVPAYRNSKLDLLLDQLAEQVKKSIDLKLLLTLVRPFEVSLPPLSPSLPPLGQRIAIAMDAAFSFTYPSVIEGWHAAGAEIIPFSPLNDESPNINADAVFLPGGFPELHAGVLAKNYRFKEGIRYHAAHGSVVYGECGGYMVLGTDIEDADGVWHEMSGLLPLQTSFKKRQQTLGYRRVKTKETSFLGPSGSCFRGHEFHYSTIVESPPVVKEDRTRPLFTASDARGLRHFSTGQITGRVAGSFIHLIDLE